MYSLSLIFMPYTTGIAGVCSLRLLVHGKGSQVNLVMIKLKSMIAE